MANAVAVSQTPAARGPSGLGMWLWVAACIGWLLGVAWQWQSVELAPVAWLLGCAAVGMAGVLVGAWLESRQPWRRGRAVLLPLFALAAALLAWGGTGWRASQVLAQRWPASLNGIDVWAVLRVEGLPQPLPPAGREGSATRWRLDAAVLRWDGIAPEPGHRLPERVSVYADWPLAEPPRAGQTWRMRLRLHPPDGLSNPGVSASTRASFGRGVRAIGQLRPGADSLQAAPTSDAPGWQDRIDRWRQAVREAILQRIPSAREAGVLTGLAVGDQAAVAAADWDVLRRTGVAHAVAISGAHVAMLGGLCAALTRRLWSRSARLCQWLPAPTAAVWVAVLGAAAYAVASGGGVPAQRTVWTMALMGGLRLLGGAWPWPLVWLSCATLVTLWDPFALVQPGFWLSFVAVAVLMSAGEPPPDMRPAELAAQRAKLQGAARAREWLREEALALWRTQRLVSLALMPLSMVCFQQVSLIGMVANLVALPLFGAVITPLALAGLVLPQAWDVAAACTGLTFRLLTWLSDLPLAVWAAPSPPLWVAVAAVLGSFALALPGPWRWRSLALPLLMPLLCLPEPWRVLPRPASGQFAAVAMDVGQGTAVLVRTSEHTLLFDTGASLPAGGDMGARVVLPVLQALGVRRLDALFISHQDNDHVGGALSVVRGLSVDVLRSSLPDDHALRASQPRRLPSGVLSLPHRPCVAGQSWEWDGVRFEVLHPTAEDLQHRASLSANGLSCVLRVEAAGGRSLLLTGDIEAAQEQALLAREPAGRLRSTVLVAPHHGSRTSSTPAFLAAVQAQQVVVQAGRRNRYGHPAPQVMARYHALGWHVDATPTCGAWLWASDGGMATGRCWRDESRRLWDEALAEDAP